MNRVLGSLFCPYRPNWDRRTPWGWWAEWGDTAPQTQIRNSSPGGLRRTRYLSVTEAPHNFIFTSEQGINILFFETWMPASGINPRSPTFQAGSFSLFTRVPVLHFLVNMGGWTNARLVVGSASQTVGHWLDIDTTLVENNLRALETASFITAPLTHIRYSAEYDPISVHVIHWFIDSVTLNILSYLFRCPLGSTNLQISPTSAAQEEPEIRLCKLALNEQQELPQTETVGEGGWWWIDTLQRYSKWEVIDEKIQRDWQPPDWEKDGMEARGTPPYC